MSKFKAVVITIGILVAIITLGIAFLFIQKDWVVVKNIKFVNEALPAEFNGSKIVQLSDLHNTNRIRSIAGKVKKARPNIILLTGDLIQTDEDGVGQWDNTLRLLEEIKDEGKIYYIDGDMEKKANNIAEFRGELKSLGIGDLNNKFTDLSLGEEDTGKYIRITGIEDTETAEETERLIERMFKPSEGVFQVLMCHRADYFETYSKFDINLAFGGHNHGGIAMYNETMEKNATTLIESRGLGEYEKQTRLLNPPTVYVVELYNSIENRETALERLLGTFTDVKSKFENTHIEQYRYDFED